MTPHSRAFTLCALLLMLPTGHAGAAPGPAPVEVIVQPVSYTRIADRLEALGTLRANETVDITATVSDTISRIHFDDGERVEAGQILVEMTDAEEAAGLTEARSLAEEAKRQYERIKRLVAEGTAAESLLDQRRREWETAEARLKAVQSRLADRLVRAPFEGTVGLRNISRGALISPGQVITTLVDDSRMKLDFDVPSIYLASVSPGTPIEAMTPLYSNETFEGQVSSVDASIDPVTRAITVRAIIPNPDRRLKPGLLMTLELLRRERNALVVAEEAIIPRASKNFVMVVDRSAEQPVAEEREVQLGTRLPGLVEVTSGLSEGETIITHGTMKVRPGSPVTIRGVDDGSTSITELIQPVARLPSQRG